MKRREFLKVLQLYTALLRMRRDSVLPYDGEYMIDNICIVPIPCVIQSSNNKNPLNVLEFKKGQSKPQPEAITQ